jgi:hypothetical protein
LSRIPHTLSHKTATYYLQQWTTSL